MARVKYWAGARDAAGTAEETVEGATLSEIFGELGRSHGSAMASLLTRCVVLVDGEQALEPQAGQVLKATTTVEILPPYAGG